MQGAFSPSFPFILKGKVARKMKQHPLVPECPSRKMEA
jgi:hypothetical protein